MKLENRQIGVYSAILVIIAMLFLPEPPAGIHSSVEVITREIVEGEDQINAPLLQEWIIEETEDFIVIDIRDEAEYTSGRISGAVNIPLGNLLTEETISDLPDEELLVLYSNGNTHVSQARALLSMHGKNSVYLNGGYNGWQLFRNNPASGGVIDDEQLARMTASESKKDTGSLVPEPMKKIKLKKSKGKKKRKGDGC